MPYLDQVLQPGETVLAKGRLHWVIYLPALGMAVAATALAAWASLSLGEESHAMVVSAVAGVFLLAAVVTLISRMIVMQTTEFVVTDQRVIAKRGFLSLHTVEMNLDKVESVDVDMTMLGRLLGYGSVTIHGVGSRWDPIPGIADPLAFRNAITTRTSNSSGS